MNKHLIIIALCGLMAMVFASCSRPQLTGTWVEPAAEDGILPEKGFTLCEDGQMIPINMGHAEFNAWERQGDLLLLKGIYTGMNQHEFVDTMRIEKLDETQLVLEQAGYKVVYQRK